MRKRILALILALVMCLSLLPAGALADDVIAEGTDKDISWSLDTNGTLTVSGTGSIQYEYSTAPWKPYAADIKALVVGEGITMIGKKAFDHLENLETISLPSGFMRIYDSAFSSCTSLKSIVIPEGVKSIGNSAFSSCTSLKSIVIP